VFFYEIHEGDDELGTAVLLGHEQRFEPQDFFQLVKKVRAEILESFEEDTLSEAIAAELQRRHGFVYVTDDLLVASVNVDENEQNTFLVTQGEGGRTIFVERDRDSPNGDALEDEDEE
jgi:hypothetical protein